MVPHARGFFDSVALAVTETHTGQDRRSFPL